MPLAFLIGIHGFVWILPALVFGPQLLLRREPIVIPRSVIPLLLLVVWIPVTMLQLPPGKFPLVTFRLLVFASTLVCLLWLVNETEERVQSVVKSRGAALDPLDRAHRVRLLGDRVAALLDAEPDPAGRPARSAVLEQLHP